MRLKRVESDSCDNCLHFRTNIYPIPNRLDWIVIEYFCFNHDKKIGAIEKMDTAGIKNSEDKYDNFPTTVICEDSYEDDGSRIIE